MISSSALLPILAGADDPLSHVVPHGVTSFGEYTLQNHVVMLILSAVLLAIVLPIAARAKGIVPRGFRNLIESVLQYLREDMTRPILGSLTDRFIPYVWTVFFLILTANLLGLLPLGAVWRALGIPAPAAGQDSFRHIEGTATGNISITAGLALCSLVLIHISGMRQKGVAGYWKEFFFGHAPLWLAPLMVPLEIIGALVKPFSLAIRLFANMIAGHVVIAVLAGFAIWGLSAAAPGIGLPVALASVLGALFIGLVEILVAFLQAYIFTFLTTLFVGMAVQSEH